MRRHSPRWSGDEEDQGPDRTETESETRGVRTQAAEGLQAVADGTGKVLDRGGDALRRAEEVLQDTKEQVGDAIRSGQDAIRPAARPREA